MDTEDLTTYTEVDPNGHIDATAARCTMTGIGHDEDAYRYRDKGVDHETNTDWSINVNVLIYGGITSPENVQSGQQVKIDIGQLDVSVD